jgi:hypothetical protein
LRRVVARGVGLSRKGHAHNDRDQQAPHSLIVVCAEAVA